MIRLKNILKENEQYQKLPTELKKHFLEIISTYGQHREGMERKSDIRQVAETLGTIADAAQEYTLREGGDWFDKLDVCDRCRSSLVRSCGRRVPRVVPAG